jgi:hypothetical protein
MVEQSEREEMMVVEERGWGSGGQECPPSEGADILGRCLRSDFCASGSVGLRLVGDDFGK